MRRGGAECGAGGGAGGRWAARRVGEELEAAQPGAGSWRASRDEERKSDTAATLSLTRRSTLLVAETGPGPRMTIRMTTLQPRLVAIIFWSRESERTRS